MSRPEPPRTAARPTLLSTAPRYAHDATLRMLAPHALPADGPRRVRRSHRRRVAAGAVLLLVAIGAALAIATKAHRPPAPTQAAAALVRPRVPPVALAAPAAPAVIESIAAAADQVAPAAPRSTPLAAAVPHARRPSPGTATKQRKSAADPAAAPVPAADADVDLLAAMVTRLQATEATSDPCRTDGPARVVCPARPELAAVPRAPAR